LALFSFDAGIQHPNIFQLFDSRPYLSSIVQPSPSLPIQSNHSQDLNSLPVYHIIPYAAKHEHKYKYTSQQEGYQRSSNHLPQPSSFPLSAPAPPAYFFSSSSHFNLSTLLLAKNARANFQASVSAKFHASIAP
jgi:hypothetical protein